MRSVKVVAFIVEELWISEERTVEIMDISRLLDRSEVKALLARCETCIHKDDPYSEQGELCDPCYSCDFENNYRSVFDEPT